MATLVIRPLANTYNYRLLHDYFGRLGELSLLQYEEDSPILTLDYDLGHTYAPQTLNYRVVLRYKDQRDSEMLHCSLNKMNPGLCQWLTPPINRISLPRPPFAIRIHNARDWIKVERCQKIPHNPWSNQVYGTIDNETDKMVYHALELAVNVLASSRAQWEIIKIWNSLFPGENRWMELQKVFDTPLRVILVDHLFTLGLSRKDDDGIDSDIILITSMIVPSTSDSEECWMFVTTFVHENIHRIMRKAKMNTPPKMNNGNHPEGGYYAERRIFGGEVGFIPGAKNQNVMKDPLTNQVWMLDRSDITLALVYPEKYLPILPDNVLFTGDPFDVKSKDGVTGCRSGSVRQEKSRSL